MTLGAHPKHRQRAAAAALAAALASVCSGACWAQAPAAAAGTPLWHYAVEHELALLVRVTWAALPGHPAPNDYVVQRCQAAGCPFDAGEVLAVAPSVGAGPATWTAVDQQPLAAASYYRVAVVAGAAAANLTVVQLTEPRKPYSAQGALFVVNNQSLPAVGCGSLTSTPPKPCPTVQSALSAAASGATVYVAPGVYSGPGNRDLDFGGRALTLQSTNGLELTSLHAEYSGRVLALTSGEGRDSVVAGLTLQNGTAEEGGCVLLDGAAPTLRDLRFFGCSATGAGLGGAVLVRGAPGAGPRLERCEFTYNLAEEGGALAVYYSRVEVAGCTFEYSLCVSARGQGGALYLVRATDVAVTNSTFTKSYAGWVGGVAHLQESTATFVRCRLTDNQSGSFGAGLQLTWSNVTMEDSEISGNYAYLYGGAVFPMYGFFTATRTRIVSNGAQQGGGAIKIIAGGAQLTGCEVSWNRAKFGGAFDVYKLEGISWPPTIITDSVVEGNFVEDHGAGFALDSYDQATFANVTFRGNVAAMQGGAGWCGSLNVTQIRGCRFEGNVAAQGGALFLEDPCRADVWDSEFTQNTAAQQGGGIAATDGTALDIQRSLFVQNGASPCAARSAPLGGGALAIGIERLSVSEQCGASTSTAYAVVTVGDSIFSGNMARDRGGAVLLSAGALRMEDTDMLDNRVMGGVNLVGVGGALAAAERCSADSCDPVVAELVGLNCTGNSAAAAGGAIFFAGTSAESTLELSDSLLLQNSVNISQEGVGGGAFLGRPGFTVKSVQANGNVAFYGAALFLFSSLVPADARLANVTASGNEAAVGPAAFWVHAASPTAEFQCQDCSLEPQTPVPLATEVLRLAFARQPPQVAEQGQPLASFTVQLLDYYSALGIAAAGDCVVMSTTAGAAIQSTGSRQGIEDGQASFDNLRVQGEIGATYALAATCEPQTAGHTAFVPAATLDPLPLSLTMAACQPGSAPVANATACEPCSAGQFSADGQQCVPCPTGGACYSGTVVAKDGWWRSGAASVQFYQCTSTGVCKGEATAGEVECQPGRTGPLCAVCEPGYFRFAGSCRACDDGTQAKAVLAVTATFFAVVALTLLARTWGVGAGVVSKIKIFVTHFQMLALLRDYDVLWPAATAAALSWFEVVNVGVSILAPECIAGSSYSFYAYYVVEVTLPLICTASCVAIHWLATLLLRRLDPLGVRRRLQRTVPSWLAGLQLRCWRTALWLVTLLYPRAAMASLQLYSLHSLDTGTYLRADYSLMVRPPDGTLSPTYIKYAVPGAFVLALYAVCVPLACCATVFRHRRELKDPVVARRYGFLYKCYTPRLPYWETAELLRKLLVALVPVFVPTQVAGSAQAAVGMVILQCFLVATLCLHPFARGVDSALEAASLMVLWLLLLSGTAAKWAGLDPSSQRSLAAFQLLLASGWAFVLMCMAALALMQAARGTSAVQPGDSGCARAESSIGALGSAALPPVAQPPHEHTLPLRARFSRAPGSSPRRKKFKAATVVPEGSLPSEAQESVLAAPAHGEIEAAPPEQPGLRRRATGEQA